MAKPRKVAEPATPYTADKPRKKTPAKKTAVHADETPAHGTTRYAADAAFRKAAEKVFKEHDELFRKLAQ